MDRIITNNDFKECLIKDIINQIEFKEETYNNPVSIEGDFIFNHNIHLGRQIKGATAIAPLEQNKGSYYIQYKSDFTNLCHAIVRLELLEIKYSPCTPIGKIKPGTIEKYDYPMMGEMEEVEAAFLEYIEKVL